MTGLPLDKKSAIVLLIGYTLYKVLQIVVVIASVVLGYWVAVYLVPNTLFAILQFISTGI